MHRLPPEGVASLSFFLLPQARLKGGKTLEWAANIRWNTVNTRLLRQLMPANFCHCPPPPPAPAGHALSCSQSSMALYNFKQNMQKVFIVNSNASIPYWWVLQAEADPQPPFRG